MKRRKFPKFTDDQLFQLSLRPTDVCGKSGKIDLHHAIISKSNVMGMPDSERAKINDPRNILKVDHAEHLLNPPTREVAIRILVGIYGYQKIKEWWESLVWKSRPPFQFPRENEV